MAERRKPLGNVGVYATPSAVGVTPLPFDEYLEGLSSIPLGIILPIICEIQSVLHDDGMNPDAQLALIGGLFAGTEAFAPLARFVRSAPGERLAICEQAMTLLQCLAILECEEELTGLSNQQYESRVRGTIFFAPAYLEPHGATRAADRDGWLRHFTQLFDYNSNPVFSNAMARTWTIFGRLHREASDIRPALPLDDWVREDYGLGLEQQLALGFALFAHLGSDSEREGDFNNSLSPQSLGSIFRSLGLDEKEGEAAEALVAAPASWFRAEFEGQDVEQLSWNRIPFMQHPFIRLPSGQYLLQSPRALLNWVADGIHYRCLDAAKRRDAVPAYTTRIGKLTERYALDLVGSVHQGPRLPGAGKVHGDKKFGHGLNSSDITITYPNEVVLMEVASHRLTVESLCHGDQDALERDLKEMVGRRPKQLRRSIDAMKPRQPGRATTLRFDHLDPERIARFWPLIITATPLHWSPLLEEFMADPLAEVEGRDDVEALDVLAIEDLEALVAITEETGRPLAQILAAKLEAAGPHADLRTWLSRDRRFPNLARPRYLDVALDEMMDIASRLLGFPELAEGDVA